MINLIRKKINEKKGLNSIEMVIGSLIVIVLFAGMADFIRIHNRMQSISSSMTYISKVVSNQGCLANDPENAYVRADGTKYYYKTYIKNKKYVDSTTLYNTIKTMMENDKISTSEWRIYVGGKKLSSTTKTDVYDFRKKIPIEVQIDYSWKTLAGLLPVSESSLSGTLKSSQSIVSTYKIREAGSDTGFTYGN